MKRRDFLKNTTLASSAMMIPSFLKASGWESLFGNHVGKKLVVIQLSGGNDGLNTIVPFENDIYYRSRPKISVAKNSVIRIGNDLGLNPELKGLESIFKEGEMSIINNVGYPNPNRSHFRSMDIWQTGSASNQHLSTGWLGRYLDNECSGCNPYFALDVDDSLNLSLKGKDVSGFATDNINQLRKTANNPYLKYVAESHQHFHHDDDHENVEYLYKTMIDTQSSAKYLFEKSKVYLSKMDYPQNKFGKDLKQISELMTAKANIKIYYATLGGFDTHAGQKGKQNRLLKMYGDGMKAFVKDLKRNKLFDDTLILTFSEFGRRVKENAGGGTDHGTANNVFLMGGKLKTPGFFNDAPNLSDLDNGDLKFKIDFRQIYSEIITSALGGDPKKILQQKFSPLEIV